MKRIVHPPTPQADLDKFKAKQLETERGEAVQDRPLSEISVDSLLGDGLLSLYREMRNLKFLTSKGKLGPAEAKDLRDTVKLLFELKDREKELLESLDDDELRALKETNVNEENDSKGSGTP